MIGDDNSSRWDRLKAWLAEEKAKNDESVVDGGCLDFDSYRYSVSRSRALRDVLAQMRSITGEDRALELRQEEDEDE